MNGEDHRGNFYEVRTIEVSLPRLEPDSPETCPAPMDYILEYIGVETDLGGNNPPGPIEFLRTAKIGETEYWIWKFLDGDGDENYVTVGRWPDGCTITGCDGTFDMTPEQFLVAEHFEIEP